MSPGAAVGRRMQVDIWSDVVCPWCYIGKRRFEKAVAGFEEAAAVEVRWHSFELDPRAPRRRPGSMAEHIAAKYGGSVEGASGRLRAMDEMAAAEGLRYDLARTQGGNTFDAHRLIQLGASEGPGVAAAMEEALFAAYFTECLPIGEHEVLATAARVAGLDGDEVGDVLASDRFAAEVRRDEAEAAALGCTGVPFFVVDGALAVPGAQDPDTFLRVLRRAWDRGGGAGPDRGV